MTLADRSHARAQQGPGTVQQDVDPAPERLLAVLRCEGARCEGLRQLQDGRTTGPGCRARLATAVRSSRCAVLIGVGCVNRCEQGAVVLLGVAMVETDPVRRFRLEARPQVLVQTELPDRAAALERWLRSPSAGSTIFRSPSGLPAGSDITGGTLGRTS